MNNIIDREVVNEVDEFILVRYIERCLDNKEPESVEEAVDILFKLLGCEFGRKVINMHPLIFLAKYHFTLGLYIRNCFGLWKKDSKVMRELNVFSADEASSIIMDKLWHRFRRECYKQTNYDEIEFKKTLFIPEEYTD